MPQLTKIVADQDNSPSISRQMRQALEHINQIDHTVTRNLIVCGRRTSIRIDAMTWRALTGIATTEGMTINDLASHIAASRQGEISLTAAIRMFVVAYFNWWPGKPRTVPAA